MLNAADFDRLRFWAETETGMNLAGERSGRLQDALVRVLGQQGIQTPALLDRFLTHFPGQGAFLERLTAELTVGETYFFRNEHHFRVLREHVIPAILKDNAAKRGIRVWSAGCATGEEPYSIAVLLDQIVTDQAWQRAVLGTDINPEFLDRARQAFYRPWSFRQTSVHEDRRCFSPEGDGYRLVSRIRDHVRFAHLNLVKDIYPSPLTGTLGQDLILFRNVAIYLKPEVTRAIVERLWRALRPGGWLLVAETELNLVPRAGFAAKQFDQATLFQKMAETEGSAPSPLPVPVLLHATAQQAPVVPVWVPLPTSKPAPAAALRKSVWEDIQRQLARRAFDEVEQTLARVPDLKERAALRLRCAQALLACAEQTRARRLLEQCLREHPLLLEARLLQASFAEEAGDLAKAEQAYRQALYLDRKCPLTHFHLGLLQQHKGDCAGAVRSLRTTRELLKDKDPRTLVDYGEGICYGRLAELVDLLLPTNARPHS